MIDKLESITLSVTAHCNKDTPKIIVEHQWEHNFIYCFVLLFDS